MWLLSKKQVILIGVLMSLSLAVFAQQQTPPDPAPAEETPELAPKIKDPVMKSVFWNTLLGSAWGATMGFSSHLQDPKSDFRESVILGTTMGGFFGYSFGIVLVIRGYSFDETIIPDSPLPKLKRQGAFLEPDTSNLPPLFLAQSRPNSSEATPRWKWTTPVFKIRF